MEYIYKSFISFEYVITIHALWQMFHQPFIGISKIANLVHR